ncbi:Isochorismatase hydrolase [Martensiomyces pterosporus]|nr:Isochorismatase hydrolase [Martensiomyces pterosporus]
MSKASRILEVPLFVTEQYPKGLGSTASEIDIEHAVIVEPKSKFSMVTPAISAKLQELNIKSVVLYGIESHVCVLQTCLELLDSNYDVHVLADGVSSMNHPEIDIALRRMTSEGAHVVSSESVLFQLTSDSKDPKFKAVSNLVKEFQEAARHNELLFKKSAAQL